MAVSAYSGSASGHRAVAEINITPLVDVMLVLLVIFMMAAPVVGRPLPVGLRNGDTDQQRVPPPQVTLRVDAGGAFALDGQPLDAAALAGELRALAVRAPTTVLEIDTAADSDYQGFATALGVAKASGLQNVALPQ